MASSLILGEHILDHADESKSQPMESKDEGPPHEHPTSLEESPELLYSRLQHIDPVMANKLHPNDVRRVKRSLRGK